jgi:hypothetical protein
MEERALATRKRSNANPLDVNTHEDLTPKKVVALAVANVATGHNENEKRAMRAAKRCVAGTILMNQFSSMEDVVPAAPQAAPQAQGEGPRRPPQGEAPAFALPWLHMSWSWDGTSDKGKRSCIIDEKARVVRVAQGSSEHVVQTGRILYPAPAGGTENEEILTRPVVVPDNSAGTLLCALQKRWEETHTHPMRLASSVGFLFLLFVVDAHSSNLAVSRFLRKVLPQNCFMMVVLCTLHQLANISKDVDDKATLKCTVPVQSLSKLMTVDKYFIGYCKNIATSVRKDPLIRQGQKPPDEYHVRIRIIVMFCLGLDVDDSNDQSEYTKLVRSCLRYLNGNWLNTRVEHWCWEMGCCGGSSETSVDNLVWAACELLCKRKPMIATQSRWGKQLPSYGWWFLGVRVHGIGARAFNILERDLRDMEEDIFAAKAITRVLESFNIQLDGQMDSAHVQNAGREELRQRRQSGNEYLNSEERMFYLGGSMVALSALQHLTKGVMKVKEAHKSNTFVTKTKDELPFRSTLTKSKRALKELRACLSHKFLEGPWTIIPKEASYKAPEDRLLKLRLAVLPLRTAGGIFIRSIMAFENHSGDIACLWALLEAASTGADSEREDCDLDAASYANFGFSWSLEPS